MLEYTELPNDHLPEYSEKKKHWPNASYWQSIFDRHDLPEIMLKIVLNVKS